MHVAAGPATFEEVRRLYLAGRYVDAYGAAVRVAPLPAWRGADERLLAGRLAEHLGASRLGNAHFYRAYREHPQHADARCYYAILLLQRTGPARAWEFMEQHTEFEQATVETRAHWLACRAMARITVRDFGAAEEAVEAALSLCPDRIWLWLTKAGLRQAEDRYDEAMQAIDTARGLQPDHPSIVASRAGLLVLQDRGSDAIAELQASVLLDQCPLLLSHLAVLLEREEEHAAALAAWDRYEACCPIREAGRDRALAVARSRLEYLRGDVPRAISLARQARFPVMDRLAATMAANLPHGRRVLLPVPFVRQHHNTCAPATLAAICQYWKHPAEHLQIVEQICYDGTPAHSERRWAQQQGFVVREFTLQAGTAEQLIDRKIPFTLTTVEATTGHLQAVVGYDTCRGTLLIRDPYIPLIEEFDTEKALERYQSSGPRAMVFLPAAQQALLEGVDLPDASLWDELHTLQTALERHDRQAAVQQLEEMQQQCPSHYLAFAARVAVHSYDGNSSELLAVARDILDRYPGDPRGLLMALSSLERLGRNEELRELLRDTCARADTHPVFFQRLAAELWRDARDLPHASLLIRRALRRQPQEGGAYHTYGDILWVQRRFDAAMLNYRFAACLAVSDAAAARAMFAASRFLRRSEEALAFLKARAQRSLAKSGEAVCCAFDALDAIDRTPEGMQLLQDAISARPEDGTLKLFAAEVRARTGELEAARVLHAQAKPCAAEQAWLRTGVRIAGLAGEYHVALSMGRRVLELDPLAMDMHREVARRLAELEGPAVAAGHLREALTRFPHNYPLRQHLIEWLCAEPPQAWEAEARSLVQFHPRDAWAQRQLAENLAEQHRFPEALAAARLALEIAPRDSWAHCTLGRVYWLQGDPAAAADACRQAIRLAPDNSHAIEQFVGLCADNQQMLEALRFLQEQLQQQVTFGEGLLAYQRAGVGILDDKELLAHLQDACTARPDLWQAWCALARQHSAMEQHDLARQAAAQATERFPLVSSVWAEFSIVCRAADDAPAEIDALRRACELDPLAIWPVQRLATALDLAKKPAEAIELLRRQIVRQPLEATHYGYLASLLFAQGSQEEAIAELQKCIQHAPFDLQAWQLLADYAARLKRPELCPDLAHDLSVKRGDDARAWSVLARALPRPAKAEEAIAAARKAAQLAPLATQHHDMLAVLLAEAGRFDEAQQACRVSLWGQRVPTELRGRDIWIEFQRGRHEAAIKSLHELLQEQQSYYWGCLQLLEWLESRPEDSRYLDAARQASRLQPRDVVARGHLGNALVHQGKPEEAITQFERAIAISPDYLYGLRQLFELHLQRGQFEKAQQVCQQCAVRVPGPQAIVLELRLAQAQQQDDHALQCFQRLCAHPAVDEAMLVSACNHLTGRAGAARRELRRAVRRPDPVPAVAGALMRLSLKGGVLGAWWLAWRLRKDARLSPVADAAYLDAAGEKPQWRVIRPFIFFCHQRLRSRTETWALGGYALMSLRRFAATSRWLADYARRPEVRPWMLSNHMLCLLNQRLLDEAYKAARHAVTLPADHTTGLHFAFAAVYEALRGNAAAARLTLNVSQAGDSTGRPAFYRVIAQVLIECQAPLTAEQKTGIADRMSAAAAVLPQQHWMAGDRWLYNEACRAVKQQIQISVRPAIIHRGSSPDANPMKWWWWIIVFLLIRALMSLAGSH